MDRPPVPFWTRRRFLVAIVAALAAGTLLAVLTPPAPRPASSHPARTAPPR